jgi:hypothetical protein
MTIVINLPHNTWRSDLDEAKRQTNALREVLANISRLGALIPTKGNAKSHGKSPGV